MLKARFLGQYSLQLDGHPVSLHSRPAQTLLAYLLLHPGNTHRRERLAGVLWPETSEFNARRSLRQALWQVRQAFDGAGFGEDTLLVSDGIAIALNPDASYWLDAGALESSLAGRCTTGELLQVVALYEGELLPGFYQDWVVLERERVQAAFDRAMQELLGRLVAERRWAEVLQWGERWIAMGYAPEPAFRALMIAHSSLEDMSSAAAAFRRCCEALRNELGVDPSDETLNLYATIQRGRSPAGAPGSAGQLPAYGAALPGAQEPAPGDPPFLGLHYFEEDDAALFFGRETLITRLLTRLRSDPSLLCLVGASGSGKSSLLRAGLLPAIRAVHLHPGDQSPAAWQVHLITPTARPLDALAVALTRDAVSVQATASMVDALTADPRSLQLAVRQILAGKNERVLLAVDQFEELFTLCHDEQVRRAFVGNLTAAAMTAAPLTVVIALRADFYAHCAQYPALREALANHQEFIGSMSPEELRHTIEEPAGRGNWTFEAGLVDLVLRDVGEEPGALPLLSHALLETWRRREGRRLTLAGYAAAGGVHGAIARTAEQIYQNLTPNQQAIARSIFLRLTELGEGTQDTRRPVTLAELTAQSAQTGSTATVLQLLAGARLITINDDTVEVAHEALIREWPTLRQWLAEDRASLRLHRHLTVAALEWARLGRDPGELYRGARLATAREWAEGHAGDLNALESAFLAASQAEAERGAAEREAARERELEAARQLAQAEAQQAAEQRRAAVLLRRRAAYLAVALGMALSLAFVAVYFGAQSRRSELQAEQQGRSAQARELAAAAMRNLEADPERSILLALQAVKTTYEVDGTWTREAENALHESVAASRLLQSWPAGGQAADAATAHFSPDGRRVVTAGGDGKVTIWDAATGRALLSFMHPPGATSAAYSQDGRQVVTSGDDGQVRVWDALTGQQRLALVGHKGSVTRAVFSPSGQRLASAGVDGTTRVWDAASGRLILTLSGHLGPVRDVAFSPDGKNIVTGSDDDTVRIWDAETGTERQKVRKHAGPVLSVSYDPQGVLVASASADGTAKIWKGANGRDVVIFARHRDRVEGIAFSPDGKRAATSSSDGTARVWDTSTGTELFALAGHGKAVRSVAFNQDGTRLVTAGQDGTARIWDATASHELAAVQKHASSVWDLAFSPDGTLLASAGFDGHMRVWNYATGQEVNDMWAGDRTDKRGYSVAFSPDGARVAVASQEGQVTIYDPATGVDVQHLRVREFRSAPEDFDGVLDARYSPDGRLIATAGADNMAALWDAASAARVLTLQGHTARVNAIRFSPDGTRLATASEDNTAKLWDAATGHELLTLAGHTGGVEGIAFSPDGKRLATSSADATARVWDLASGAALLTLAGHASTVQRVVFSSDGKRLATVGNDATARLWDAATGEQLLVLAAGNPALASVAFSPDGTRLLVGGADGAVHIYLLRLADLLALARTRVTRSLTEDECLAYLHTASCPHTP